MTYESELAIVPVAVAMQGLRLPDGSIMAVELAQPPQKFAVMIKPQGKDPQLHSLHDTEAEAEQKCAEVLELWDGEWTKAAPKGRLQ